MSNLDSNTQKQIAGTILQQLGGNRFIAMTGAKQFACGENDKGHVYIVFKIGRNSNRVNYVKITLNGSDLYDTEYSWVTIRDIKVKSESSNIYNDMLRDDFERATGMYTSL